MSVHAMCTKKRISPGDEVRIVKGGKEYSGILMPSKGDCLIIKLRSGYNVGIKCGPEVDIELIKKGVPIKFKSTRAALAGVKKTPGRKNISILGSGGTIASRVEYRTGAVYPAFSPKDIVNAVPELGEIANIGLRKLFDLFSEDITPNHWQKIARGVAKEIRHGVDGVVITHGTDTMHYTAAALSFMLRQLPVPVILTGSQRSSDRGSSDAAMNLIASTIAATSDIAEVCICMHGSVSDDFCFVHPGTKVRKMHSSRRDTFRSINAIPYAKVWPKKREIELLRKDFAKRDEKRKLKLDTKLEKDVGLIHIHPGINPEFVSRLKDYYKGVVLAGTGLGHAPVNKVDEWTAPIIQAIKELIDVDIPVVMAAQTLYGRIHMHVYSSGRDLLAIGVIPAGDMLPETALVKLMWVLGHEKKIEKIRELMTTNLVGELSERTDPRAFLV